MPEAEASFSVIEVDLTKLNRSNFGQFVDEIGWIRATCEPVRCFRINNSDPVMLNRSELFSLLQPGEFIPD